MSVDYLSVSALSAYLKRKFEVDPYLGTVYLTGEISNFRPRANSHQYFSLKDEKAKISAVMFKSAFQKFKIQPEEGMKVLVIGRISLYEATGQYQIYIEHMEPDGIGALYQAYEKLKSDLEKEGVFRESFKQPLVRFPKRIAVITSPSGAVVRDIMTTVERRYPIVQLDVFPTLVQGDKASGDVVRRIEEVNELGDFDTIIVARGGGSIEDLWPFNTEAVVRAVFESRIPVISSVGHETDTTLTDLVADVRAATPTAAAELAVPVLQDELLKISEKKARLFNSFNQQLKRKQDKLNHLTASVIFKQPRRLYESFYLQLDGLDRRLKQIMESIMMLNQRKFDYLSKKLDRQNPIDKVIHLKKDVAYQTRQLHFLSEHFIKNEKVRLHNLIEALDLLSPLKTMSRGYSYVTKEDAIIKSVVDVNKGDDVIIHLSDGEVRAKVE